MKSIKPIEKYFKSALQSKRLQFTLEGTWLTVEINVPNSATPSRDGWSYKLVCAQDIEDYQRPLELCDRITNMLTQDLLSSKQDINIFYKEWEPKKMSLQSEHKCEVDKCNKKADRLNETVRTKGTEDVKIMNICKDHFEKITGAK